MDAADLRQMHHTNDPEGPTGNVSYRSPRKPAAPTSVRDDLIKTPPVQTTAEGEQSFARGGHGIFGMPKVKTILKNKRGCTCVHTLVCEVIHTTKCKLINSS